MPVERAYVGGMPPDTISADALLDVRLPGKRLELVRGRLLVREPPGFRHGRVTVTLVAELVAHIRSSGAPLVVVAETGFKLASNPDTVRGPDIAVVQRARLPSPEPESFADLAPDLAIEILSPNDRLGEVLSRVADLLNAGTRLVWVIDPPRALARVYRQDGTQEALQASDALQGEDVVPGFACRLDGIL